MNSTVARPVARAVDIAPISKGGIERWYKLIAAGVAHAFGDLAEDSVVVNAMADIVAGRVQVWAVYGEGDPRKFMGVLTTRVVMDPWKRQRVLLVETLAVFGGGAGRAAWPRCMAKLDEYARTQGCARIEFETPHPKMVRAAERLGFRNVSTRLMKETIHA